MPATLLPAVSEESVERNPSQPVSRIGIRLVAGLAILWVLFLAALTWQTANPPVVNVVQLAHSDFILVGRWVNRADDQFEVIRELKSGELQGPVTVTGLPPKVSRSELTWVIPVRKFGGAYEVTQGEFANRPRHRPLEDSEPDWLVRVSPQCYPATDDVLKQIQSVIPPSSSPP